MFGVAIIRHGQRAIDEIRMMLFASPGIAAQPFQGPFAVTSQTSMTFDGVSDGVRQTSHPSFNASALRLKAAW